MLQNGDLALFINLRDQKRYLVKLQAGGALHSHRGVIRHDECIGAPFLVVEPSTADLIRHIKRNTQILFPKDIGYILLKLSVRPGRLVVEAGTGSGGMTLALALATAPVGKVVSYEVRPEMQALAIKNLERYNVPPGVVEFKLRDIAQGLDETNADAFFLDVPQPWDYLTHVAACLRSGGLLATIVPTMNQVISTVAGLEAGPFGLIELEEVLLRSYKAVSARVRPADRMVAHTAFLIFARKLEPGAGALELPSTPDPNNLDAVQEQDA